MFVATFLLLYAKCISIVTVSRVYRITGSESPHKAQIQNRIANPRPDTHLSQSQFQLYESNSNGLATKSRPRERRYYKLMP